MDSWGEPSKRIELVKELNKWFPKRNDAPIIPAGDLNDTPGSKPIKLLEQHWTGDNNINPTCPAKRPARIIDRIFFRPAHCFRVVETHVINEKIASDHRPVPAVLDLLCQ